MLSVITLDDYIWRFNVENRDIQSHKLCGPLYHSEHPARYGVEAQHLSKEQHTSLEYVYLILRLCNFSFFNTKAYFQLRLCLKGLHYRLQHPAYVYDSVSRHIMGTLRGLVTHTPVFSAALQP